MAARGESASGARRGGKSGGRWTAAGRRLFLDRLAVTCDVAGAAEAAGMNKESARLLRRRDADFARRWADAMAEGAMQLEEELLACALGRSGSDIAGGQPGAAAFDPALALKLLQLRAAPARADRRLAAPAGMPDQAEVDAALMKRLEAAARMRRR